MICKIQYVLFLNCCLFCCFTREVNKNMLSGSTLRFVKFALIFSLVGLMTACGKKHGDEKSGQSLVSVNGDEITVHQVNSELQRLNVQPAQQEAAGRRVVQGLVDRQILVQAALKEKLDRKPIVMQLVENAKAQILAEVYLQSRFSSLAKPTTAEVSDYRAQHTALFANRKIYMTDQAVFILGAANADQIKTIVKLKSLKELEQWLSAHGVKYQVTRISHAAETLPPPLLAKFGQMSLGQMVFINSNDPNGRTEAVSLAEIKDAPISEKDSTPIIEGMLTQQKRKLAIEAEMKRLHNDAKIEYLNKKYDPANAPKQEISKEPVKPDEHSLDQSKSNKENSVSRGMSGL